MPTTTSEKARQNRKICMEFNKLKKSRLIQKKNPESNKRIDKQPQQNIDFNLVEPTERGMFHSQCKKSLLSTY